MASAEAVVAIHGVSTHFGAHVVHTDLGFAVHRAEIFALMGGSGSGKSTLLPEMILLQTPDTGSIRVLGVELKNIAADATLELRRR